MTRPRAEPDLDAEREVDVGRYLDALVTRWWLPLVGLVAGVVVGYLLALGGNEVFRAQATVYLGTPFGPNGNVAVQSLATNPNTVARTARGGDTIDKVSASSGMSRRELRAGIATQQLRGGLAKTVPSQLYVVSVKGSRKGEVGRATTALAQRIVDVVGGYAIAKIGSFREELVSDNRQLATIGRQIDALNARLDNGRGLSSAESLGLISVLTLSEQRRGTLEQDRLETRQLLLLAEQVELPRIVDRGAATKTTARSTRNSAAVAGLFGLVLGLLAALLWEPVASRTGRG